MIVNNWKKSIRIKSIFMSMVGMYEELLHFKIPIIKEDERRHV